MYLVVLVSERVAPSSRGRCTRAVAKVLSTTTDAEGLGDGADRLQVDHLEQRVGRALQPHHRRLLGFDLLECGRLGEVHPRDFQAELGEHLLEQPHGAAVQVLFAEHQIALLQLGDHGGDGADAGANTVAWAQPSTEASTPSRMRKLGLPERV